MKRAVYCFFISVLFLSCNQKYSKIIQTGYIDCFPVNTINPDNSSTYCEASAILYNNGKMYFASDKTIPGHSSVFYSNYSNSELSQPINYIDFPFFKTAMKYEDFSLSHDKKFIFLTTGFDRFLTDSSTLDQYCTILYWQPEKEKNAKILSMSERNGIKSSFPIREKILFALQSNDFPKGVKYFKIEGLASIPGDTLLFGIREIGYDYADFKFSIKILSAKYTVVNDEIILTSNPEVMYSFNPEKYTNLNLPLGLSSIEYDSYNNQLYILTSFENGTKSGAYIWKLSMDGLRSNKEPVLVINKAKQPLLLEHKAEDITIIDNKTIAIICDDDRVLEKKDEQNQTIIFKRTANQAAYYIIKTN